MIDDHWTNGHALQVIMSHMTAYNLSCSLLSTHRRFKFSQTQSTQPMIHDEGTAALPSVLGPAKLVGPVELV